MSETRLNGGGDIVSVLTARGLLNDAALDRLRRLEQESGERIDRIAAKLGMVSDKDLAGAYAGTLGSPLVTADDYPDEPVAADRIELLLDFYLTDTAATGFLL